MTNDRDSETRYFAAGWREGFRAGSEAMKEAIERALQDAEVAESILARVRSAHVAPEQPE